MDNKSENKYQKNLLKKIRSKYVLKIILEHLKQNKFLKIIKYNKELQKKLDIKKNDYIEYSKIEIDIFIKRYSNRNNNFINIKSRKDKKYLHIYFNDNGKKKKRTYLKTYENISKIKIIIDHEFNNFRGLFERCKHITKINFIRFNRDDINDMSSMFKDCTNLTEVNFNNISLNNVTNMSSMFYKCSSLTKLDLSKLNTANVLYMDYMFYQCIKLEELNISNFDIRNVIFMEYMFYHCLNLKTIIHPKLYANKVTNSSYMLYKCSSLNELNICNFNNNIDNFKMLYGCSKELKKLIKRNNKNINFKSN